jgi:hypothetical protein
MFKRICLLVIVALVFSGHIPLPVSVVESAASNDGQEDVKANNIGPVLAVTPREIDFGAIVPSREATDAFIIKNVGSGAVEGSVKGPEGWSSIGTEKLTWALHDKPGKLKISLSSLKEVQQVKAAFSSDFYLVKLTIEANQRLISYEKRLPSGAHREMLKLLSDSGRRTIFLRFELVSTESEPVIDVEPMKVDFGVVRPGEQVTRRVKVTNKGMNTLKWDVSVQNNTDTVASAKNGRYISFLNEDMKGSGVYSPPSHLSDAMDMSGKWLELDGYPSGNTARHILKYRFLGTGIFLLFSVEPDGGDVTAYVEEKYRNSQKCHAGKNERAGCMVAEGLPYGQHTLTIVGKRAQVMIEGVRIYGQNIVKGNPGWINIFPDSGTTTSETDFVNIMVNVQQAGSGFHTENVVFNSNGGQPVVEVLFEIAEDNVSKILDVYRYVLDSDYLYTSNPQDDAKIIHGTGYGKQGIAFRLFSSGAPGTTAFYRWYHPGKKMHFYSYDRSGEERALKGYNFEGMIGNIGTSRLNNTKELYRWVHPVTGGYFYTTDSNGEGHSKKGYRFDGIAGYVR